MNKELKMLELPCGIRVIGVPGWGEPMLVNFTNWPQEAKASILMPNDWSYEFIDKGSGAYEVIGTPIYDDSKPMYTHVKNVVTIRDCQ